MEPIRQMLVEKAHLVTILLRTWTTTEWPGEAFRIAHPLMVRQEPGKISVVF